MDSEITREKIIKLARKAGFVVDEKSQQHQPNCILHTHYMVDELLERFAVLVAQGQQERCAQIAEKMGADFAVIEAIRKG